MGKFLEAEKPHQAAFKATSPYFSEAAREEGIYRKHVYPFCLPKAQADENLFKPIRKPALEYFSSLNVKWHDGQDSNPSNHMCGSQVACVNFLFPFAHRPKALAALFKPAFPTLREMLPVECGLFVGFEWIGQQNYLNEITPKSGKRSRGALFTSADAIVRFRHTDGQIEIALIEWKYTEAYYATPKHTGKPGRKRMAIYQPLFEAKDCPINKRRLPNYRDLVYEPFYQFMRQQFLAHKMEIAHELGADRVSLLHITPAANIDFKRVTSPGLREIAPIATQVWDQLVRIPGRFNAVSAEKLFGRINMTEFSELKAWWTNLTQRYHWLEKPKER